MATQTNNLLVLNSGLTERIAAEDQISISSMALTKATGTGLAVTADATVGGDATVTGSLDVTTDLDVTGATTLATLTAGAATLDSASVTNNATVGGTLGVTGAATLSSTLAVTGATTLSDDLTLSGAGSDLSVGGNASVSGTSTLSGNVSAGADLSVGGNATVTGTTTSGGALTVSSGGASITGNSSVTGTFGATGAVDFDSTLNVDGNSTLGGTLTVTGDIDVGGGDFQVTAATGAVTMNGPGALSVTGLSNLDGGIAVDTSNFTVSGTTGATHVAGDFDVATSKFTVASASGNTVVAGTLNVTGAATLSSSLSALSATITNNLTAANLYGSNSLDVGAGSFVVDSTGTLHMDGDLDVNGTAYVNSTLGVLGAVTFSSTLDVTGDLDVNSNFSVDAATGNVSTDGTLTVAGASTLTGNVSASGDLTVSGATTLTGAATASSTLAVTGLLTGSAGALFNGDVDINGDLTVNGDIVSKGVTNLTVIDAFIDLGMGNSSTAAQSGGLTVEMNRNAAFTNVWSNLTFTAGVSATSAPTIAAGTAGSALAAGDIIAVIGADENNGYYVVASVAGSTITLKGVGGSAISASVPFAQNQVQAETVAAAELFKCDIGALAIADGTTAFKDSTGGAWAKGTFVSAYVANASEAGFGANNAWQSVGQVDLQEAYNVGNTIQLADTRNLIVSKPASGAAGFQIEGNANSAIKVSATSGQALNVGVYDAAGTTPQSQVSINDVRSAGNYDISIQAEAQIQMRSMDILNLESKTNTATFRAIDAGNAVKGSVVIEQSGNVTVTAAGGAIVLNAGNTQPVKVSSDLLASFNTGTGVGSSTGYGQLDVASAVADKLIVSVQSGGIDVASPTAPNIMGVTIAAADAGKADIATAHGTLVKITKSGAMSVGDVVYLVAGGQISATAPSSSGDTIMRVGYVVGQNTDAAPVVYFAPQFIAKVL